MQIVSDKDEVERNEMNQNFTWYLMCPFDVKKQRRDHLSDKGSSTRDVILQPSIGAQWRDDGVMI